jgi:hypothetical protein
MGRYVHLSHRSPLLRSKEAQLFSSSLENGVYGLFFRRSQHGVKSDRRKFATATKRERQPQFMSQQTKGLSRRHGGGFYFAWTISAAAG